MIGTLTIDKSAITNLGLSEGRFLYSTSSTFGLALSNTDLTCAPTYTKSTDVDA